MTTPADTVQSNEPLAARMRPRNLDEVVGQDSITRAGSPLRSIIDGTVTASVVLWAPPASGKTTLASIIASTTTSSFVELSATSAGVKDVRAVLAAAEKDRDAGKATVLFLDEIHRFTKAQQDILLPAMESGLITLIGATTENPSFSVNAALLSRSILIRLNPLTDEDVETILRRAVSDPRGLNGAVRITDEALELMARLAASDSRQGLNRLETAANVALAQNLEEVDADLVATLAGQSVPRYDRDGDQHYDVISAFIKSMRGSDPDAALHWLAVMLTAGEDPRFIARRLMIHASEDVGLANPAALLVATAAAQAVALVGMPEAQIILSQATLTIATSPKSPQSNSAIKTAMADVAAGRTGAVPNHLRDAHYPGAKALGHGAGYLFPHDDPSGYVTQQYLPDALHAAGTRYYHPTVHGAEKHIKAIVDHLHQVDMQNPDT